MATNPYTHIQNSAPGPPDTIAVATPAMLPVPIDAASAVMNAWNGVSAPASLLLLRTSATRQASANRLTCTNRVRTVRITPAPRRTTTTHGMNRASASDWIREATQGLYQGMRVRRLTAH